MTDTALNAAMLLLGPVRGHRMLGCDWGVKVSTTDDPDLCERQARRIVVVHGWPKPVDLKVCDQHAERVLNETDPHREAVGP